MQHLRRSVLCLLAHITLLFNIERLDLGAENLIDLQSFVYVLATGLTILILIWPRLWRLSRRHLTLGCLALYLPVKFLASAGLPLWGGIYTYILITEAALLVITALLAQQVAHDLHDFEEAVANIMIGGGQVRRLEEAEADIQLEMLRSRRHHRPLSVVMVAPQPGAVTAALHRTVEAVQRRMMRRYVLTALGRSLAAELRRLDLLVQKDERGALLILAPETDRSGTESLIERVQQTAANQGIAVTCGMASFPDDALTFEELVEVAERQVAAHRATRPDESLPLNHFSRPDDVAYSATPSTRLAD